MITAGIAARHVAFAYAYGTVLELVEVVRRLVPFDWKLPPA
jgi:hypothetical protein